ncbi:DNA-binding transcriptional regulator KdgR [Vibrio hippocampi]|uniref:Pectin degradation repressor protein KdgR n=1 Tax=Vibrio hippocampi TaxID=654686 RepID=A0ABN8DIC2_9VIBR|nr:DNA-binding transcriptional regulator KdgR [Vibrio hippocampi]CAH0528807.1 Pectin degradation repressor protein KdgR [Vibrio hippocampi]
MEKLTQPESVASVLKVFNIVSALADQKEAGVSELSQQLRISKATTYRFLKTMTTLGFVHQESEADKYALTSKLFELGSKALDHVDLIDLAHKEMEEICEAFNETVELGSIDEESVIYLHKVDSSYHLRMHSRIGRRNPLYNTAIGKVLMGYMPEAEVRALLAPVEFKKHTDKTHETVEQLLAELRLVKRQHFAEDIEEQEPGLRCIAVPVFDRFGQTIAAISVSFPTIRFDEKRKHDYIALLHNAGGNISKNLGYHNYPA